LTIVPYKPNPPSRSSARRRDGRFSVSAPIPNSPRQRESGRTETEYEIAAVWNRRPQFGVTSSPEQNPKANSFRACIAARNSESRRPPNKTRRRILFGVVSPSALRSHFVPRTKPEFEIFSVLYRPPHFGVTSSPEQNPNSKFFRSCIAVRNSESLRPPNKTRIRICFALESPSALWSHSARRTKPEFEFFWSRIANHVHSK
jgi:hypothetical protein